MHTLHKRVFLLVISTLFSLSACSDSGVETESVDMDTEERLYTYRAIAGISMGGGASAHIALSNPDRYDFVGILGAPLVDLKAFARMIRRNWMQGFCSLEELESRMAQGLSLDTAEAFCGYYNNDEDNPMLAPELRVLPPERATQTDVLEFASDYHNWYRGPDGGRGGSFHRVTLLRSLQDIFMAYGNPMYDGSGEVPWAAPGITREWLNKSKEERCENPLVIPNFYNAEYNPNGEYNAITYCDGYVRDPDGSFEAKLGRLLPDTARTEPISVVLAIDLNGNNRRDYGEPVVINAHERYNDTGIDGLADEDEPGYDSLTNPDPNNDNWDAFLNPTGTENNWWYDEGEAFEDLGLDGVANTGDHGENDSLYTITPVWDETSRYDPNTLISERSYEDLGHLNIYMDAGIRDFLNTAVSSNRMWSKLIQKAPAKETSVVYDFDDLAAEGENLDIYSLNSEKIKRFTYLQYGDPDAGETKINNGNGNHVGTADEALNRVFSALTLAQRSWPDLDMSTGGSPLGDDRYLGSSTYESQSLGRTQNYSFILPPGYYDEENVDVTYPVLYFLHGQGQDHTSLLGSGLLYQSAMSEKRKVGESLWGKFIVILPDGKCPDDICEKGNFYVNHVDEAQNNRFQDDLYELMDIVDERFRTRAPELKTVPKDFSYREINE